MAKLKALASTQLQQVDQYGYQRYPLMKAFRRSSTARFRRFFRPEPERGEEGLARAVPDHGQISFDGVLYADVLRSLDSTQKAYLDAMKGKGWKSWPDIAASRSGARWPACRRHGGERDDLRERPVQLVSGSLEADVYFCPERHGTYYGGFYIKDAPRSATRATHRRAADRHRRRGADRHREGLRDAGAGHADVEPGGQAEGQPVRVARRQHRAGTHTDRHAVAQPARQPRVGGPVKPRCCGCRGLRRAGRRQQPRYATVFAQVYKR